MPKRPETPPPGEDEPRYLTVVHPYPLNASFELPGDQHNFIRWLACCTGKDVLLAFFHKPSSPGMAIVEVDRYFDGFDRLIGEHKWSKALQNPSEEELGRVSKVYYCTLNTGRKVEKHGWKRINVKEHWFHGWQPQNRYITYPYPETSYCETPPEDKTNFPLCRPLPVKSFPPSPPAHLPPVGSPQWLEAKNRGTLPTKKQAQAASKATGARAKGAPKNAPKRAGSTVPPPIQVPTPAPSIRSAAPSVVSFATSNNPWNRGPPSSRCISPRVPALSKSSSGDTINTLSPALPTPNTAFPTPPGLEDHQRKFSWSEDVERSEAESESVDIYLGPDGYGYEGDGTSRGLRTRRSVGNASDDESGSRSLAGAMEDLSFGAPPSAKSWSVVDEDDSPWPAAAVPSANGQAADEVKESDGGDGAGWAGYADPKEDPVPPSRIPSGISCPDHGLYCKRGICAWRSKREKMEKYAKQDEERKKEKEERDAARAKKAEKKAKELEAAEVAGDWRAVARARAGRARKRSEDGDDSSSSGSESSGPSNTNAEPDGAVHEDWTPAGWNVGGGDDALSVASTMRKAWSSVASSAADSDADDDQDDVRSVASARTTTTDRPRSDWATSPTPWDAAPVNARGAPARGAWDKAAPPQRQQGWGKHGGAVGQAARGPTPNEIQSKTKDNNNKSAQSKGKAPLPKNAWGVQSTAGSIKSGPASETGWEDTSQGPW